MQEKEKEREGGKEGRKEGNVPKKNSVKKKGNGTETEKANKNDAESFRAQKDRARENMRRFCTHAKTWLRKKERKKERKIFIYEIKANNFIKQRTYLPHLTSSPPPKKNTPASGCYSLVADQSLCNIQSVPFSDLARLLLWLGVRIFISIVSEAVVWSFFFLRFFFPNRHSHACANATT